MDERKGKREVAPVLDVVAEIPERFDDSRRAQHGGPHRRARNARPRIDRRAENGDRPRSAEGPLASSPSSPVLSRLKISPFP